MKVYDILCKNDLSLIYKKPYIILGIIYEEDYSLVIIIEITLTRNFISNVSQNLIFSKKNKILEFRIAKLQFIVLL